MKLPFFNFNDSYPLTLGVSDDYFTLSTRLQRLARAPMQPRRRTTWLLGAALCISFAAVVPFRLTARAQNQATQAELSGTVKDQRGNAVADATVYAMPARTFGSEPLEIAVSDENGRFRFSEALGGRKDIVIFADANDRGMGQSSVWQHGRDLWVSNPIIAPLSSPIKLLFVAPDGKRAANLRVRLGQLGEPGSPFWWAPPRQLAQMYQTSTNARGEAVLPPLPQGTVAQFWPADATFDATAKYGMGDLRGDQTAPIPSTDALTVGESNGWKTIRLLPPVTLRGRVTAPGGAGVSGVAVLARFINAAEARGDSNAREMLIAHTRTDANGVYVMKGLRPGLHRIELAARQTSVRDAVSAAQLRELTVPTQTVDLPLTRGGVIKGKLRAKDSGQPLAGQAMALLDSRGDLHYTVTDARGAFQFRAIAGHIMIWVALEGYGAQTGVVNSRLKISGTSAELYKDDGKGGLRRIAISKQTTITRDSKFLIKASSATLKVLNIRAAEIVTLPLNEGTTREITIESAINPKPVVPRNIKPITGAVIGPDGQGAAGAVITIQNLGEGSATIWRASVRADEKGRFTIPTKYVAGGVRLIARDSADASISTPRAIIATAGDKVTLKLERDVAAAVEGQIVDKISGKPIADVNVICHSPANSASNSVTRKQTDAQGRFRFDNLRPFEVSFLQTSKRGYQEDGTGSFVLQKGQTQRLQIFMHPLGQTLSGRVLLANGQNAGAGYMIYASGQKTQTKADGSFVFPNVLDEKFQVTIGSRAQKKSWGPFWTRGGRAGVTFGLTDARLDTTNYDKSLAQEAALRKSQWPLVGTPAPPIRALRWIVGDTPSFQGQVTLLHFVWENGHSSALDDFARSFRNRGVQVVSIEQLRPYWEFDVPAKREQYLIDRARDMNVNYPTAIDAPLAKRDGPVWLTGESHRSYRGARYVIVGRDGIIKWVGGDGGQAIAKTIELAG